MSTSMKILVGIVVVCFVVSSTGCMFVSKKKYDEALRRATECEGQRESLVAENDQLRGMNDALRTEKSDLIAKMQAKPAAINQDLDKLYAELQNLARGGSGLTFDPNRNVLSVADVNFDTAKADLTSAGQQAIAKVAETLRAQSPNIIVRIDGHTDNVPVVRPETKKLFVDNSGLSAARALTVLRAMEKAGVASNRLYVRAFGPTRPVAANDTPEMRQKNRRVEISFVTRYEPDGTKE